MLSRPRLAVLCALLLFPGALGAEDTAYAPAEILVRFRPSAGAASTALGIASVSSLPPAAADALRRIGALDVSALASAGRRTTVLGANAAGAALAFEPLARTYRVRLPPGSSVDGAIAELSRDAAVEIAEPNRRLSFSATPNDSHFSTQWAYVNTGQTGAKDQYDPGVGILGSDIDAPLAWDVTTGDASLVVAVIDSGVDYAHPDLAANMWENTGETLGNGVDDDLNGLVDDRRGWDFASWDNDPTDNCGSIALGEGHGTHVAGIVGAVSNNAAGVAGTAWNVKVMPLKVAASGCGLFTSDVVEAIQYATAEGARIINMSLGGNDSAAFRAAVDAARASGVTLVAAAGNHGDSTPIYPGAYASVIGVAATDRRDAKASFSAFGPHVSLAAPGVGIRSTYPTWDGSYSYLSGTSMASPMVAGIAALVLAEYPALTPDQVEARLLNASEDIGVANIGAGRINAARALLDFTGASPSIMTASISTTLTLTGKAFQAGMSVRLTRSGFSPITATAVSVANHQSATCQVTVPSSSTGTWNVEVVIGNTVAAAPGTILVEGVEITAASPSVWPSTAVAGPVMISGRNFGSNLTAFLRRSGQANIPGVGLTVLSSTAASVSFDVTGAAGGRWDVVVSSAGAESALSRGLAVTTALYQVVSPPLSGAQYPIAVSQGTVILDWPSGATASPVQIDIDAAPVLPALDGNRDPYAPTGIGVTLEVVGGQSVFDRPFTLTLPYREIDLFDTGKQESLTLAFFNENTLRWQPVGAVSIDSGLHTVSGSAAHFSSFQVVQHIPAVNLDKAVAYPNPFRPDRGNDRIVFDFLMAGATLKVFDLSGHLVRELVDEDGDGRIDWIGVTNESGDNIASGVYYYVATAGGKTKAGRVAVLR